jgi:hypothetical protein
MKISQFLKSTRTVVCLHSDITVETTAGELLRSTCSTATTLSLGKADSKANSITLAVLSPDEAATKKIPCGDRDEWMFARASETNGIELYVSHTWFLYRLACRLTDDWLDEDLTYFSQGKLLEATFKHLRPAYDSLLNNHARTTKGFDPEDHIREMARQGYTHVEVNGFAANFPYEKAAPGELLYLFYTY